MKINNKSPFRVLDVHFWEKLQCNTKISKKMTLENNFYPPLRFLSCASGLSPLVALPSSSLI